MCACKFLFTIFHLKEHKHLSQPSGVEQASGSSHNAKRVLMLTFCRCPREYSTLTGCQLGAIVAGDSVYLLAAYF